MYSIKKISNKHSSVNLVVYPLFDEHLPLTAAFGIYRRGIFFQFADLLDTQGKLLSLVYDRHALHSLDLKEFPSASRIPFYDSFDVSFSVSSKPIEISWGSIKQLISPYSSPSFMYVLSLTKRIY